jgi:hypothetical protein
MIPRLRIAPSGDADFTNQRLFQNFSFGTATLNLSGKAGFRPLFRKPVPKLTEFCNRLIMMGVICVASGVLFRKTPCSNRASV